MRRGSGSANSTRRRVSEAAEVTKHVIVIASGETERRALPYLVRHLQGRDVVVDEVRIPPRNKAIDVEMAEKLVKTAWYEHGDAPPDKFVLLMDLDGADPAAVVDPIRQHLPERLHEIRADIHYAYAQQHLEAWYFAEAGNLRRILGRALGHVDTSNPDGIRNPKRHLKNLLGSRVYTARVSEDIARRLDAERIAERSPSFKKFIDAVMNGNDSGDADGTD